MRNSPKVILSTCPEATGERPRKGPDSAPLSGCFCPESESRPWGPQSTSWDCSPPLAAARGDRHHPPPPLASDSPTGLRVCPETPKHTDPAWIVPVPRLDRPCPPRVACHLHTGHIPSGSSWASATGWRDHAAPGYSQEPPRKEQGSGFHLPTEPSGVSHLLNTLIANGETEPRCDHWPVPRCRAGRRGGPPDSPRQRASPRPPPPPQGPASSVLGILTDK